MFSLILNGVGSLLHLYCAWRVGTLPWVRRRVGPARWWLSVAVVWVVYVAGVEIGDDAVGTVPFALAQFAFHWLAALFLLSFCLLAADVATGFGLILRRRWSVSFRVGALAVAVVLVGVALAQGLRAPVVTHHEVALADLPPALDGTTVVAVSDLHLGASLDADWMAARAEQIRALKPDVIVLVGDLVEDDPDDPAALQRALRRLRAPLGVWAVTGNHEFHGEIDATNGLLESTGIRWLRDRAVRLAPGLRLAGVDDHAGRSRDGAAPARLLSRLAGEGGAALLLSHAPEHVEPAAEAGFDLMLSGHTHGGQVWPFGYVVRQRYPYFLGRYRAGDMTLIVGRGTGSWGARMRLWRPGEILHVTLRSGGA